MKILYGLMLSGIVIIIVDIVLYPLFLPKVIDSKSLYAIETQSYIFYLMLFFGISIIAFGLRRTITTTKKFLEYNNAGNNYSTTKLGSSYMRSLFKLIIIVIARTSYSRNKKFSMVFWCASIGYGLFFSMTSGILIYRADGLSHGYDIESIPSVTIISYGSVGYVPTLSVALTENIGFLVIPINLVIMIIVSVLVGLNAMLSFYAFDSRPKKKAATKSASLSSLGLIGAATGLFTACPTCASLFIFNFLLGSFAPAIATFTAAFYTLFIAITIPLLLITPIITAIGIRRMQSANTTVCSR